MQDIRSSRSLYNDVSSHLNQIRDVLTPRVMSLANEPELVELLLEIEARADQWRSNLQLVEDDWGMPEDYGWEAAIQTLLALADTHAYLAASGALAEESRQSTSEHEATMDEMSATERTR